MLFVVVSSLSQFADESFLRDVLVREYGEARDVRALKLSSLGGLDPSQKRNLQGGLTNISENQAENRDHHIPIIP